MQRSHRSILGSQDDTPQSGFRLGGHTEEEKGGGKNDRNVFDNDEKTTLPESDTKGNKTMSKKKNLRYPEMLEYAWAKDLDRVRACSKFVSSEGKGVIFVSERPRVPVNLVLAVLKEATAYPEVMHAYGCVPLDQQTPQREGHLLMWFHQYLSHKYGTEPDPVMAMGIAPFKLARGEYTGIDDPKLLKDLLDSPLITADDGLNYEQEPANVLTGDTNND